ncbi:fibrinogen C domain-containing protein 1-like [Montipora capricornis]|uniref:fibrinogen C domain-containing protein 1-like n=1 Tax=Montipora capricornis TaxID=246305 RepID=UPI0035F13F6C
MMFLLFSGLVLLSLEVGHNVEGALPMGCKGGNCHNSFLITPDVLRPTSCLDYLLKGQSNCGIYRLYDNAGNSFPAFCDLNSEPGTAWTLVISCSWGTQYRSLAAFKNTRLKFGAPVNEYAINWNVYRLSLTRMRSLQSHSTHWRATRSYPTHCVDFTDYVRGTFSAFGSFKFSGKRGKDDSIKIVSMK